MKIEINVEWHLWAIAIGFDFRSRKAELVLGPVYVVIGS